MEFIHFPPSERLKPYIRHYYLFQSTSAAGFDDIVFPSGDMEMIFNLGEGNWSTPGGINPPIELWGQITRPLAIHSTGKHTMLGVRFFPHSAACFLDESIGAFNDQVADLGLLLGNSVHQLHARLQETDNPAQRIALFDSFLVQKLNEKKAPAIHRVGHILKTIAADPGDSEIRLRSVASQHGITARYLNMLVYRHTGLTPVSFHKIKRFQFSLKLIARNDQPLTSIAYDCGYFDQSHFIKEFKSFTGLTPSAWQKNNSPVNQLLLQ